MTDSKAIRTQKSWVTSPLLATAKLLVYKAAVDLTEEYGGTPPNAYAHSSKNIYTRILGDILPDAVSLLERLGAKGESLHVAVSSRVRAMQGGEHRYFTERPEMGNTVEFVNDIWSNRKTASTDDLYHMMEKDLLAQFGSGPGVYVRGDTQVPERAYVGHSGEVAKRSKDHEANSHMILMAIYPTLNVEAAHLLEQNFFELVQASNLLRPNSHYIDETRRKGRLTFKNGIDAVATIKDLFTRGTLGREVAHFDRERVIFHNKLRIEANAGIRLIAAE